MSNPTPPKPETMPLTSMDIAADKLERLKQLLPEVFAEGKVDWDQLKRSLGEWVEPGKERFGLQWPGKAECMKVIQQPSVATLKPCREESVDFDTTENLFIEGDNLEVLKLLQKSYFGKVKMIYIDPPYNTGKEFIYPDKYAENLDTYLAYTGQVDAEGRKFSTNTDAVGRYHSNWLNMMYPRLYLARNLLQEDGVIFISIDDNELTNLQSLCNMIFGEENFICTFVWKTRQASGKQIAQNYTSVEHEYILVYGKSSGTRLKGIERDRSLYTNPDSDPRGDWAKHPLDVGSTSSERPNCFYTIIDPRTGNEYPANPNRVWAFAPESMKKLIAEDKIIFDPKGKNKPYLKKFWSDLHSETKPISTWLDRENFGIGYNAEGTKAVNELFEDQKLFDYPKPVSLIKLIINQVVNKEDIILDFFAGSGTTFHAALESSMENEMKLKCISVQLPEPTDTQSDSYKAGYKNIADLSKERIRRAAKRIADENAGKLNIENQKPDLGFKVFKLDRSNFKVWQGDAAQLADEQKLAEQLSLHIDHISKASTPEDILYELLLKAGFPLTTRVEQKTMAGKKVFAIQDGALLICLEKEITQELVDAMAGANPLQVICLDEAFKGNDQLKANAVQTFRSRAQAEQSEIVFRTV
jgi:adenine-specific DNA-methyltransferase